MAKILDQQLDVSTYLDLIVFFQQNYHRVAPTVLKELLGLTGKKYTQAVTRARIVGRGLKPQQSDFRVKTMKEWEEFCEQFGAPTDWLAWSHWWAIKEMSR